MPFFKVSDMNSDGNENEMTVANNYVTAEQIAAHRWSPIEELPAIFFAKVGAAVMLNRKRLCRFPFLLDNNTMAYSLSSTEWDADFAKALFETIDLTSLVQVGALPSYNAGDVEAMAISMPSLSEQGQIGEFFKQLDNLITLHQRNSADFVSRFFSDFTNTWEQRKLGELTSLITKGTTPLDKSNIGTVNFVKIESIDNSSGEITITQKISSEEHEGYLRRSQLKENDILFSIAGTLGRVTSVKSSILPANTNQALAIIRLKSGCLKYVKTYLKGKAVADFIKKNPTIGAQPNLSLEQVSNLDIALPSEIEQEQIGAFFEQLDNLITLHQCEYIFEK